MTTEPSKREPEKERKKNVGSVVKVGDNGYTFRKGGRFAGVSILMARVKI
jgi:hypothetical protein